MPPKRIVKMLQELLNHTDNNVRRLAKDLTVELCRWIGKDALKRSLFDNLKKQAVSILALAGEGMTGMAGSGLSNEDMIAGAGEPLRPAPALH